MFRRTCEFFTLKKNPVNQFNKFVIKVRAGRFCTAALDAEDCALTFGQGFPSIKLAYLQLFAGLNEGFLRSLFHRFVGQQMVMDKTIS